jgi:hypothetical protein
MARIPQGGRFKRLTDDGNYYTNNRTTMANGGCDDHWVTSPALVESAANLFAAITLKILSILLILSKKM